MNRSNGIIVTARGALSAVRRAAHQAHNLMLMIRWAAAYNSADVAISGRLRPGLQRLLVSESKMTMYFNEDAWSFRSIAPGSDESGRPWCGDGPSRRAFATRSVGLGQ